MRSSRPLGRASLLLLVVLTPAAPAAAAPRNGTLPLTRVRFYETGVGYFERSGAVPAGETTLPVPAGHLDDALKTLLVLGGDVKVSGLAFSSSVSRDMARKLAGLPETGDAPLSFSELTRSFKGAGVTLTTAAGSVSGRLVEVLEPGQGELERCAQANVKEGDATPVPAKEGCRLLERGSLLLLTAAGELRRFASADVLSLRPNEPAARARLDAALDALSQRGAQTRRSYPFDKLDSATLRAFSAIKTTQPSQRATLLRAAEQLRAAESRLGAKPKREAELQQALADVARIRENARILGGIRAKQVESMAERIVQLEGQITQLRTRIAELTSEAQGFLAATKRELRKL